MPDGTQQWCASEAEAVRLEQLLAMSADGTITQLKCQRKFDLIVNNVKIAGFRPDFSYTRTDTGREVIEEVKGLAQDDYILRIRLFKVLFPWFETHVIKPGQMKGSRALWLTHHYAGKVPTEGMPGLVTKY